MDALIGFAEAYASLGTAVQEQLKELLDNPNADLNPNAVRLIKERLLPVTEELDEEIEAITDETTDWADDLDDAITEWFAAHK